MPIISVENKTTSFYQRDKPMEYRERKALNPQETLEPLMTQYVEVQRELKETRNPKRRRHLKRELDDLRIELGWKLIDCGRSEEGLAIYSLLSWKEHGEIKCNGMSRALVELGRHNEAARVLEAGLKRYPESHMLWVARGAFYASLEDTIESMKCFDRAILLSPEGSWEALHNKVICLEKLGSCGEAVPIIEGLMKRYPGDPKFLSERGYCAMEMGYPPGGSSLLSGCVEVLGRGTGGLCWSKHLRGSLRRVHGVGPEKRGRGNCLGGAQEIPR